MNHFLLVSLAAALSVSTLAHAQDAGLLILTKTIPLPDVQGGFNHMSSDVEHGRLFVTATAKKSLEIVDVKSGKVSRSLAGDGPAAALFSTEFNQLYVTRSHKLYILDGTTFDVLKNVELPSSLDELGYNANVKQLYAGCMTTNHTAIGVLSLPDGKSLGEIKLPAKPQGFVVEQNGNRIFANMPGLKQNSCARREEANPR